MVKSVIKNVGTNQHKILSDIIKLHNNGQGFELDPTYSKGKFYGEFSYTNDKGEKESITIPQPKYKMDVYPINDDVVKIEEMGKFPLGDMSVKSCNVDLPFVVAKGPSMNKFKENSNIISNRFSAFSCKEDLIKTYYHFLKECYRVLSDNGILVLKCQRSINGGKTINTPEITWMFAESIGFDCIDSFFLVAKSRLISGKVKNQEHSRSYTSTFYVFKKSLKKKVDCLSVFDNDVVPEILNGIRKNNIKNNRKFLSQIDNEENNNK